jgi:hypothetical protein
MQVSEKKYFIAENSPGSKFFHFAKLHNFDKYKPVNFSGREITATAFYMSALANYRLYHPLDMMIMI